MARRRTAAPFAGPKLHRLEDRLAPAIVADLPTWLPAGPAPIAGAFSQVAEATDASGTSPADNTVGSVVAAAPDKVDPNLLFVASPNGGIWRTRNATAANPSWTPLTDRLPSQSIAALDLESGPDGNGPRRLLAGTGAVTDAGRTGDLVGLLYTGDALADQPLFQLVKGDPVVTFSAPFVTTDPFTGKQIATQVPVTSAFPAGAFVGTTVTSVATRSFAPGADSAAPPTATSYLLAATERGVFIAYRLSDDSLTAFRPLNGVGGLPAPAVVQTQFFPAPVFGFQTPIDPQGLTDIAVDPADAKRVYVSGRSGVFRTNDITAATPVWVNLNGVLTAAAGRTPDAPLIGTTTSRVKVAVHGGLTGPADPNVVYVAVVNPAPNPQAGLVTVVWSTDQATPAGGSPFAGTFTLMDEPVQLSTPLPAVTDATNAKPIVINSASNGLQNGDRVLIEGVVGNAAANGVFTVSNVAKDNFTLEGSAATGKYVAGTGVAREVIGLFPDGRADRHFSLAADPASPNLVYIAGTYLERDTLTGGSGGGFGGFGSSAVLFRGDRSRPFLGGLVSEAILAADTTFQWTPLTDDKAAYVTNPGSKSPVLANTSPASDTRMFAFDANANLIEANDGGVYRRVNPRQNGRLDPTDPTEPAAASDNKWVSVNGNLQISEFKSVGFDPLGRAAFGAAFDVGTASQPAGGANLPAPAAGGTVWQNDNVNYSFIGNAGNAFPAAIAVDTLSVPGEVSRYYGFSLLQYDGANNRLFRRGLNLGSVADTGGFKGLVEADKAAPAGLIVAPNRTRPQVPGTASPAAGTILVGGIGALYEDNDPTDPVGQVVGNVTPAGFAGRATAVEYGGRQPGVGGVFIPTPRVAYVGTDAGQLFVRRSVGGFVDITAALDAVSAATGADVAAIAVDPDDWRIAYVLRNNVVFQTLNGGVTFTDITGTLLGTTLDAQGNVADGLTTKLFTLALYDGDPATPGFVDGAATNNDVLLAGGRGGVFRRIALPDGAGGRLPARWTEFGTALPNVPVNSLSVGEYQYVDANGQSRRGVGIAAGTLGRGAYVIPDAAALASDGVTQLALAAATVRLDGVRPDGGMGPLAGTIVADINNPAFVTVSDGITATTFERSTIQGFTFKGSADQVDAVTVAAGKQAGGDLGFVRFPISIDLGNTKGDAVTVANGFKTAATVVTVGIETLLPDQPGALPPVVQRVGFGPDDNLFNTAAGGSLRLRGLDQGTFTLDLGAASAAANEVFVQGTKAAVTRLIGGAGADPADAARSDTFVVNSKAGRVSVPVIDPATGKQAVDPVTGVPVTRTLPGDISGTLDDLLGDLEILGPAAAAGRYTLLVSDQGATGGNNGVVIGRDAAAGLGTLLNLGGPTGTAALRYNAAVGSLVVRGSDSPAAEAFTIADPLATLTLDTGDGPDTLNVQALTSPAGITTGAGDDLIRVSSRAGVTDDGDLSRITVPLDIQAGSGDNRLIVSNAGSPVSSTVTITRTAITGAAAGKISYAAAGGRFVDPAGGPGVLYLGSNLAADQITLASALNGSQTTVDGRGGPDSITVVGDDLAGADVVVRGGGGGDTTAVSQGIFGVNAASLLVVGTGTDSLVVQGYDQKFRTDSATLRVDGPGAGSVFVDGGLTDTRFVGQARVTFDGLAGRNNLNVVDNTNTVLGSPADPASGIVFAPLGEASGEVRLGSLLPVIAFRNVNGSDADGLVVTGDPTGTGKFADTLTVVGPSETGLGGTGNLAGLTATAADSTITVSDRQVVFERSAVGPLRTVALGRVNGRSTISNLVVLAGNQSKQGDRVTVVPSKEINILVDGQGPARSGTAGNVLTVGTDAAFTLSTTTSPTLGGPQTRVQAADGGSFGYRGFGRLVGGSGGGRSIYAVGADVGGGPRVRVYDALTNEVLFDQFVYEESFTGGVRVATGDVTGDGVPDLVVAAGPGGGPRVSVYDGVSFKLVSSFFAYEESFRGGLYLAVGDLDGNGFGEIVTGTGVGGGPLVKAFDAAGKLLTSVFAFEDTFRGGVRVAVGDVTGDGKADIVTTAGPGGGPVVRVFDPTTLRPIVEYFAADENLRTGLSVAAGDLTGDGVAEIVVGPASGPVSVATVRRGDGSTLEVPLFQDQPADPTPAPTGVLSDIGGVRLATADADSDGNVKVILAARGPGFPSRVYRYFIDPIQEAGSDQAFEDRFVGGVWVG